jgi:hypothetical protein
MLSDADILGVFSAAYSNPTTLETYTTRLKKLGESIPHARGLSGIISEPDASYDALKAAYPNVTSRKNAITTILALFKHSAAARAAVGPEKVQRWKKFHDDMDSFQEASYKKNMPSDRQIDKYTTFEEMATKYRDLKKNGDPHATLQSSQWYVLLSLYLNVPPKRSDLGSMRVYADRDPNKTGENYLVLRTAAVRTRPLEPSYMVFTAYKTADAKGNRRVDEVLTPQLHKDVMDSIRRHPRTHLFVNRFGKPFASNNAYSKYVIRIFEALFGRSTGVTMLRHIFITEKVDFNEMNDEQLEEISGQMMHSTGLQRKYNWSKAKICDKLNADMEGVQKKMELMSCASPTSHRAPQGAGQRQGT